MSESFIRQRYRLSHIIGEGGMGKVWQAEDIQTAQTVAVKEIHPELATQSPELLRRFEREAKLLRDLNHPNIIHLLDYFAENQRHYLVMPFMQNGSLTALLRHEGPLSVARVRRLGLDLCDALTRAHRLGVIHRDLKPDNILLDDSGNPILTDFGVAHLKGAETALTREGAMVGSIGYVSPEVCQGQTADERSDIWSLGIVFYEMLAGAGPFQRETISATLAAILYETPNPLDTLRPNVPFEMVGLLDNMLEKDPAYRIDSVRQVAAALERVPDTATPHPFETAAPTSDTAEVPPASTPLPSVSGDSTPEDVKEAYKSAVQTLVRADMWMIRRYGIAFLVGAALVIVALFLMHNFGKREEALPVPTLEPLAAHQRLLLVADFEQLGGDELAVGRIIADQLDRKYTILPSLQPVAVRRYPRVLAGEEEARQLGAELGADLVVWGTHLDERIDARLTPIDMPPGRALVDVTTLTHPPEMALEEANDPLALLTGALMNQIALAKNDGTIASMIFTVMHEWPRQEQETFFPGSAAPLHMLRFYILYPIDKDAALEEIDAAIRQESTVPTLYQLRSVLLSSVGSHDEAREAAQICQNLDAELSSCAIMICFADMAQAHYQSAVETCKHTRTLEDSWITKVWTAIAHLQIDQVEEALTIAQEAVGDQPMTGYPQGILAVAQLRLGQIDAAIETVRQLLQDFPDSTAGTRASAHFAADWDFARVYDSLYPMALGRYEDALEMLAPDPNIADESLSAFFRGYIYCLMGEDESAEAAFDRAIDIHPNFEIAYLMRAEVRRNQGDLFGAGADLTQAGLLSPGEAFDALVEQGTAGALSCQDYALDRTGGYP